MLLSSFDGSSPSLAFLSMPTFIATASLLASPDTAAAPLCFAGASEAHSFRKITVTSEGGSTATSPPSPLPHSKPSHTTTMLAPSRVLARRAPTAALRRNFTTTRPQLSSPYHYPEGPRSNIPFNPLTKFFAFRYWAFMATGFGLPFGIAVWQTYKNQ
ncbi:hypothetical protein BST61_g3957 [Cercospora zeina]